MIYLGTSDYFELLIMALFYILIYSVFIKFLYHKSGAGLIGDLGFIYTFFLLAYTLQPALVIYAGMGADGDPLLSLNLPKNEILIHFWRHGAYIFGFILGYVVLRGANPLPKHIFFDADPSKTKVLFVFIAFLILGSLYIYQASGLVETYYDHYMRFDHLDWISKKICSFFIRMKLGLYCLCLLLIFCYVKKRIAIGLIFIVTVSIYELIYSYGSRIQVFIFVLQVICVYHYVIKPISILKAFSLMLFLLILFGSVEIIRLTGFLDGSEGFSGNNFNLRLPSELGSVFYPGAFLYSQREMGLIPRADWQMYFYEFLSLFTFGDFLDWSPMEWFRVNYFPNEPVPPWTMGPIADSAIWGGEIDLFMHGVLNGLFFAAITRWFSKNHKKLWVFSVYVYVFGSCILTIKYSTFYVLNPVFKNLLPVLALFWIISSLLTKPALKKPPIS